MTGPVPTRARTVLADSYDGKRFNGTNDVVVKKDGAVYFTDMFGALVGKGRGQNGPASQLA